MIFNPSKRLCLSSRGRKLFWKPIVDEEYLKSSEEELMIVGKVKDRRLTEEILRQLNEIYPWKSELKHIRRLNQTNDQQLEILLYPQTFSNQFDKNVFEKYFHDEIILKTIPLKPCLFRWQYEQALNKHWTNLIFRENAILEKSFQNKDLNEKDFSILQLLRKLEEENAQSNCSIIVSNEDEIPLVAARDYRDEHPLEHSTMIAIDLLADRSIYSRPNLIANLREEKKEKRNYLLNGCSIYLIREPCIMCSMALLHSRISNVFFLQRNSSFGSLVSRYQLHLLKKTNHRFNVYQLEEDEEEDERNDSN